MHAIMTLQLDINIFCTKCGGELTGRTFRLGHTIEVDPCVTCLKSYQLDNDADNDSSDSPLGPNDST